MFKHAADDWDGPGWELWLKELTSTFHYEPSQTKVARHGLEVYADSAHKLPLALIVDPTVDVERACSNARDRGFQFVVTGEPNERRCLHVGAYEGDLTQLPDLPSWMAKYPRTQLVPKSVVLQPFRAEDEARKAFQQCHDAIYKELANDPAATFDLLLTVVAAKILDERSSDSAYRFALVVGEEPERSASRLQRLLGQATRWLGENISASSVKPTLSGALATRVVRILQNYSFTLTTQCCASTDLLGTAYESIVGSTFRGELGSYFTPRTIADFIARLLNVQGGRVLDPACGSAGLLLAINRAGRHFGAQSPQFEIFGNDINPRMVRAARLNLLLHNLEPSRVLHGDGLKLDRMLSVWFDRAVGTGTWWDAVPDGEFDCVVANPPFAGHESDESNLARIESAHGDGGKLRSLNRTIPFLESIVASLKDGGVAGLVIPTSILNAEEESFVRFRELLLRHAEILAIIGLPEKAFVHTDSGVHGALLFLKRCQSPRPDYSVFVDWARNLGYDRLGRHKRESDFPAILGRYRAATWPAENTFALSKLLAHGRLDPAFIRAAMAHTSIDALVDSVPLTDLLDVRDARFSRVTLQDDEIYRYFEVSDANVETGAIERVHETTGFELRKKGRIKVRTEVGDILLPNHRDSLIAKSAPTGRSVVMIGPDHDDLLTTDRFIVLRPRIHSLLLATILNSAGVRRQIVAQCRGAASLDIRERTLAEVRVPRDLVEGDHATTVIKLAETVVRQRRSLAKTSSALSAELESAFGGTSEFRPESAFQL